MKKEAVTLNQVTQAEFDVLMEAFKQSLPYADPSSVNRTRSFTLVPVQTAAALARTFGRSNRSAALLRALGMPLPDTWQIADEQEANAEAGVVDLLLEDELEDATEYECADLSLGSELTQMAAFESQPDDEAKMKTYVLTPIPQLLAGQLNSFIGYRTSTFQAVRSGGAVASISAEGDKKQVLRFFGWAVKMERIPEGGVVQLQLLLCAGLGNTAQEYIGFLRDRQGLRYSSIANYLNSLVSVTSYAYNTFELPADTAAMDPSPLTQMINLRAQAEKASKQVPRRVLHAAARCRMYSGAWHTAVDLAGEHVGQASGRVVLLGAVAACSRQGSFFSCCLSRHSTRATVHSTGVHCNLPSESDPTGVLPLTLNLRTLSCSR